MLCRPASSMQEEQYAEVIANAKQVVSHWHEFGPRHGFSEDIHFLEQALRKLTEEQQPERDGVREAGVAYTPQCRRVGR